MSISTLDINKLKKMTTDCKVKDQEVELKNPIKLTYNRLLCDVYFKNKKLADFFPKYLAEKNAAGKEYV